MLISSILPTSTSATDQAMARLRIRVASFSRTSGASNLESRSPRMRSSGLRMQAAAATQPKSEPRPTSSTPATSFAPVDQAAFSKRVVHFRRLSRRSLSADAESAGRELSSGMVVPFWSGRNTPLRFAPQGDSAQGQSQDPLLPAPFANQGRSGDPGFLLILPAGGGSPARP